MYRTYQDGEIKNFKYILSARFTDDCKVGFFDTALCLLIDSKAFLKRTIDETVCWPVVLMFDIDSAKDNERLDRRGFETVKLDSSSSSSTLVVLRETVLLTLEAEGLWERVEVEVSAEFICVLLLLFSVVVIFVEGEESSDILSMTRVGGAGTEPAVKLDSTLLF